MVLLLGLWLGMWGADQVKGSMSAASFWVRPLVVQFAESVLSLLLFAPLAGAVAESGLPCTGWSVSVGWC